jgi:hypothetical protein
MNELHPTSRALLPTLIRGAAELEHTANGILMHRLPAWARAQTLDPQLHRVEAQPSGVRLAFRTDATAIELDVRRSRVTYEGLPARPDGIVDLVIDGVPFAQVVTSGGHSVTISMTTGEQTVDDGPHATVAFAGLPGGAKDIELWLPHNETIEILELRSDSPVDPASPSGRPVWVHHGSSISQGSNATRPTGIWPAVASRIAGVELVNLGFGGSALLDPFVGRVIRDTPADVISLKLGINVVNADLMRMRAFGPAVHGLLDTVREGQPNTPIIVVSPIFCGIHEDTPGPGAFDLEAMSRGETRFRATGSPEEAAAGKLTLTTIRGELARVVADRQKGDANLTYVEGLTLYGAADAELRPLPDALHPDEETHRLIGERFAPVLAAGFAG